MNLATWVTIAASAVGAATPLMFAALGELVTERAGVLNLGVEGMMLVGAMSGFAVGVSSGSLWLAFVAAAMAGILIALVFGVLTLSLQTNQVATGLALTLFGVGLSAFAGRSFVGLPIRPLPALHIPLLTELPLVGPLLFHYDPLVYLSLCCARSSPGCSSARARACGCERWANRLRWRMHWANRSPASATLRCCSAAR
jgi:ABC-type uncharacterized transport system permease subunit